VDRLAVGAGLAFLYAPILVLAAYSFNAGRLVTVWSGASLRWYRALFADGQMLEAVWTSLRVGVTSASLATLLGLLAAVALTRRGGFRGRLAFSAVIYAPLVMPEVILGLSLLLLFVAMDVPRGFWTVTLSHATVTLCYAAVVLQARLASVDPSLEEAARDLGRTPLGAFVAATLPVIAPAVAAAWMLTFALSLDDLVIASFTSGPGATTLPLRLYSQVRLGVNPEINAVSTLMIGLVGVGVALAFALQAPRSSAFRASRTRAKAGMLSSST
jgi:putrescine transport system permease protein